VTKGDPVRRRLLLWLAMGAALGAGLSLASAANAQTWPLWESYTRYVVDDQGRVIDHSAQDHTTSEGQAYALFFALVANDRIRFDKLLSWTEINLAGGDLTLHLPAWSWGRSPDGTWKILDPHPASDADLWMAYSLLEAGRLWHETRYEKLGTIVAIRIAQLEVAYVPGLGTTLLSGSVGFHPDDSTWVLNPSYMPSFILVRLSNAIPRGPWGAVLESLQPILAQGSGEGFAMDWVSAGTGIRPSPPPDKAGALAVGSYDAIRVYLWLGISEPTTPGVRELLAAVTGMADYMKSHGSPPEVVDASGRVLSLNAPPGFSAAIVPYLQAVGMRAQARTQMDRLAATRNPTLGLYGRTPVYYDQNLALFSTGWVEQRYRFDRDGRLKVKWR
jgi:endo-1,4-beta-D-glucanase Y